MAYTGDPTVSISLYFRGANGVSTRSIINVAPGLIGSVGLFVAGYAALFGELTGCALFKASASYRQVDQSSPLAANGATNGIVGVLTFEAAGPRADRYIVIIPGVNAGMITSDPLDPMSGITLDLNKPALAAFAAAWLTGIGGVRPAAPWNNSGDPWGVGGPGDDFYYTGVLLTSLIAGYRGYEEITTA